MKHIILAGISVLALGAGALQAQAAPPQKPAQTQAPAATAAYVLVSDAELAADMPRLKPGGSAKTYAANFIKWVLTPGHMIERSRMLADGAPPDIEDAGAFSQLVKQLADGGNADARLFSLIGSANDINVLEKDTRPLAVFFLQAHRLHQGSLFQKIDALAWMRKEAETNMDAAFTLGGFLIDQGAAPDYLGPTPRLVATSAELAEGTALLKRVAAHATLPSMMRIADLLEQTLDTPEADPVTLRQILELTVAATDVTPGDDSVAASGLTSELGGGNHDAVYEASTVRAGLAELLEAGLGGPKDVERAKALYLEAAKATQDSGALKALKRLGVDVSAYEPEEEPERKSVGGGDGWEDQ